MRRNTPQIVLVAISIMICTALHAQKTVTISTKALRDKIAGGWAGKMIGVTYGAPSEFHFLQAVNNDSIKWSPADIKGSVWQDDLYVQLTFLMAMDQYGIDAPAVKFQEMLAKAGYPLWCANMQARKNYFDGIYPPASGSPEYSFRADDIDFQIEADYIGFMNPGMPGNVVKMAGKIGHIMNYGDGVYGGIFLGALYSAAYFENNIPQVIQKALQAIPANSDYARIIKDVIKLHAHYPDSWQTAWKELDNKWGDVDISGAGHPFNIDAKINGAYIVMGLLYGGGDVNKTMEITTRCGQDSDCNPSSALAVIGLIKGFSQMPAAMQEGVKQVGDSIFINTTYSFNSAVEQTYQYAIKLIIANGGKIVNDQITIPQQAFVAAKAEDAFPKVVFDKSVTVFTKSDWIYTGHWEVYKQKSWDGKSETPQAMVSSTAGDTASYTFTGTGISLMGNWVKDGGRADVYLDGMFFRTIDTYYNYSNQEHRDVSIWHIFQLPFGIHTVRVVAKGEKNPTSAGTNVYITRAISFQTGPKKSDTWRFTFE
ncbi:MAG: ADP-ribosylglycohydrolase family protein [Chitinophagaceae bacterium]|nr:ADP-ribosylglycohydrolase family protein [Chitinophagaceae bacterium]